MKLSVIVCVRNEKDTILEVIDRIQKVSLGDGWTKEIIIVDNLSTDGTREILRELKQENIQVVYQTVNLGKSNSIRTAIPLCSGDFTIPQDADLEYHPIEYPALIAYAQNKNLDVVFGSRVKKNRRYHAYRINEWGIKGLTWLINLLFATNYSDVATCYKLMRTKALKTLKLKSTGFDLDFELSAKFSKLNWRIGEIKIDYESRTFEQGRKMKAWRNGFRALRVILREWIT